MANIDKDSKTPIHHQLYKLLKASLENGEFPEGSIIPSEAELQKKYDISRITVRRAIADLEHDGYVKRQRGIGTVVVPKKSTRDLTQFQGFSDNAKNIGKRAGSIILMCSEVEASVKVSEMLNLQPREKVCYLKRLRLLDGKLLAVHETYISLRFGFSIKFEDFDTNTSLYDFLERKGIVLGSADETNEAKMPSSEVKRDLYLGDNEPIYYSERVTFDENGDPVEYSENSYIASRYKYNIRLKKVRG